jgi:hypothetical protein
MIVVKVKSCTAVKFMESQVVFDILDNKGGISKSALYLKVQLCFSFHS